jgi:hypothetical protein
VTSEWVCEYNKAKYILVMAGEVCYEPVDWHGPSSRIGVVVMLGTHKIPCSFLDYGEVWNRDNDTTACCVAMEFIKDSL